MKWNQIYKEKGAVQKNPLQIIKTFSKLLPKNKKINILDLGCGTGRHSFFLAKNKNVNICAFDVAREGLKYIKEKQKNLNVHNIQTFVGNFSKLPFKDNQFDAVLSTKALHHGSYKNIKQYVLEIGRVLKSGGLLLLMILSEKDFRAQTGKSYIGEINTRVDCDNLPDANLPHHFFTNSEIEELFLKYKVVKKQLKKRIAMKGLKPSMYHDIIFRKL